jgi:nucleolar protein 14
MPPSQLKRLKSSLREQGITGPQKSKNQKKAAKGAKGTNDRVQRNVALQQIRDSFNPFELKAPSRPAKFQHANSNTNGVSKGSRYKDVLHRPGVSKSAGEEMRKKMLLPELQSRNKVGGLVDRRIGEGDPGMTAEERAVQRFTQEKQRKKGANLFNLEDSDDDEPRMGLTHGGRGLDELSADDFGEDISVGSESEDGELMLRKRRRSDADDAEAEEENGVNGSVNDEPERKKTKKEVMEEVIAKSKLHKYERQKAKEDDDDLREELDSGMNDMLALLKGHKRPSEKTVETKPEINGPMMNPDRQKLLDGADPAQVDREYDARLKKLAQDARARPSERTKTDEEKAIEEAARLKELEEKRVKRMRGMEVSDDDAENEVRTLEAEALDADNDLLNEAAELGFTNSAQQRSGKDSIILEDEDEFELDEDLIASDSEAEISSNFESDEESDEDKEYLPNGVHGEDEEDEFTKGFTDLETSKISTGVQSNGTNASGLAFTYPCPRSHEELLDILKNSSIDQLPVIIQRVRALHHPSLSATNKEAMADFSESLVIHLSYMGEQSQSLSTTEQVIRHLHSLSRTYHERIASAFRDQLQQAHDRKELHAGDLVILMAIGSIYPTSDHFHQVVTPAMTLMARWLGMTNINSVQKDTLGAYLVALVVDYQRLSKRYIPEAIRFTILALSSQLTSSEQKQSHLDNLLSMAELWKEKSAFIEIFTPTLPLLSTLNAKKLHQTLQILLQNSRLNRRPLQLHRHRPLAIRTNIPKFEDNFDPDKHYDPDKERSDTKKLQKEYKRERKGALRELRKDANFVARQQLQEKKERDREYEKKYRRLVAEVQGEEGREAKEYEREKRARKRQK